jgi:hypothetical protein
MVDVTGRIGFDEVELNNAATEATLKLLLTSSMAANKQTLDQLKQLGIKGGLFDKEAWEEANVQVEESVHLFDRLNLASRELTPAFQALKSVSSAYSSAISALAGGSNNMSDVFSAFKVLPGPIGAVAGLFGTLLKLQEQQFAAYQKLTTVGTNLGGNLDMIRVSASRMGLTMDQLAGIVSRNGDALSRLGGGTDVALKSFMNLGSELNSSPIGRHLRALGYTTEQLNEGMLQYLASSGGRTSKEMQNTNLLIQSTGAYLEELDGLARLTGKKREQQQQELDEATKNAAYQARLAGMTEEQRLKAQQGAAEALALGGKGALDAYMSKLMGIAPDKAGQYFISTAGNLSRAVDNIANDVLDSSKKTLDHNRDMVNGMRAAQKDFASLGREGLYAIIRGGGPLGEALQQLGVTANKAATMTDDEIVASLARVKTEGTAAELAVDKEKRMQQARDSIIAALDSITEQLTPIMMDAMKLFVRSFREGSNLLQTYSNKIPLLIEGIISAWAALKIFSGILSTMKAVEIMRGNLGSSPGRAMWTRVVGGPSGGGLGGGGKEAPPKYKPGEFEDWKKGATASGASSELKSGAAAAEKAAEKGAMAAGKDMIGKTLGKLLPGAGLAFGAYDAYERFKTGDILGGGLSAASGAASLIPGFGIAAALALDAVNVGRDLVKSTVEKTKAEDNKPPDLIPPTPAGTDPAEKVSRQLELLNNHMVDIKSYMVQTATNTRRTATELYKIHGDVWPTP